MLVLPPAGAVPLVPKAMFVTLRLVTSPPRRCAWIAFELSTMRFCSSKTSISSPRRNTLSKKRPLGACPKSRSEKPALLSSLSTPFSKILEPVWRHDRLQHLGYHVAAVVERQTVVLADGIVL